MSGTAFAQANSCKKNSAVLFKTALPGNAGALFFKAVELCDESGRAAFEIADLTSDFVAVFIRQDERRETIGVVFFLQVVVLILHVLGLVLRVREIDEHEHE